MNGPSPKVSFGWSPPSYSASSILPAALSSGFLPSVSAGSPVTEPEASEEGSSVVASSDGAADSLGVPEAEVSSLGAAEGSSDAGFVSVLVVVLVSVVVSLASSLPQADSARLALAARAIRRAEVRFTVDILIGRVQVGSGVAGPVQPRWAAPHRRRRSLGAGWEHPCRGGLPGAAGGPG